MLQSAQEPLSSTKFKKVDVCKGSLYENIAIAARKKDRAIMTTDLHCGAIASDLSKGKIDNLNPRTGGCFKTQQVLQILTAAFSTSSTLSVAKMSGARKVSTIT